MSTTKYGISCLGVILADGVDYDFVCEIAKTKDKWSTRIFESMTNEEYISSKWTKSLENNKLKGIRVEISDND